VAETLKSVAEGLKFDPVVYGLQLVLFIVLLLVMNALYWKPVLAHLKRRDKEITDAYLQRDRLQHEMEQLRADYLARLAEVEADARSRIQAAVKDAQTERERILAEARATAEETLRAGVANLEKETADALQSLRGNMVGLASDATSTALGNAVDAASVKSKVEERIRLDAA
jgi:F-type H+-transporting ATPase subunit b